MDLSGDQSVLLTRELSMFVDNKLCALTFHPIAHYLAAFFPRWFFPERETSHKYKKRHQTEIRVHTPSVGTQTGTINPLRPLLGGRSPI